MNGLNRPDSTHSVPPGGRDPIAWASAVAAFAEALRRAGPEGVHVPADDARRLGEMLAGAEAPGSFHAGLRQGEAQARAAIEAMTVLHVRAPTDAERAAFVEAARNQPPGALVAESPDACDAFGQAVRAYETAIGAERGENADGD